MTTARRIETSISIQVDNSEINPPQMVGSSTIDRAIYLNVRPQIELTLVDRRPSLCERITRNVINFVHEHQETIQIVFLSLALISASQARHH